MAASSTDCLFGQSALDFGPCNVYFDTASGGENIFVGGYDQLTFTLAVTKLDLVEAQGGARPSDKAITAQNYTVTFGMSRPTITRLEKLVQGFDVERDSNDDPVQLYLSSHIAERDSTIWKQMSIVKIIDGIESTDEFDIWDFPNTAPMSESTELLYDAGTQRFYSVTMTVYESTQTDDQGRYIYGKSRRAA